MAKDPTITPRPSEMMVLADDWARADALFQQNEVRQCVVALLESELAAKGEQEDSQNTTCSFRDAGDLMCSAMNRLREDPWLMLGLSEDAATEKASSGEMTGKQRQAHLDKITKTAFRRLALHLHPDKNAKTGMDTTALFACLYTSYEKVGTEAARAAFNAERAEEMRQRREAKARGGVAAAEALERRFAKERVRREKKAMANWAKEQKATFHRWATDDAQHARVLEEKDAFRLRQRQLDEGRRQRASKLQDKVLKKRNDHKRAVSQKIQRELLREEDEARAAMALLQQRAAQLKAQQRKARKEGNRFEAFRAAEKQRRPSSKGGGRSTSGGASAVPRASSRSGVSKEETGTGSVSDSEELAGRTEPAVQNSTSGDGEAAFTVTVTFSCEGPMGFTLGDTAAMAEQAKKQLEQQRRRRRRTAQKGQGKEAVIDTAAERQQLLADRAPSRDPDAILDVRNESEKENGHADISENDHEDQNYRQHLKSGNSSEEVKYEEKEEVDDDGNGRLESLSKDWAAAVVGFAKTHGGLCEAKRLGVLEGDVLQQINGYDLRGMRFKELCAFLGRSPFPRTLTFWRHHHQGRRPSSDIKT